MAVAAWHAATAAVDKREGTQGRTVVGAIGGHGSLQKERLDLGFFGEVSRRRGVVLYKTSVTKRYLPVNVILGSFGASLAAAQFDAVKAAAETAAFQGYEE
jgi:hypothetical protein